MFGMLRSRMTQTIKQLARTVILGFQNQVFTQRILRSLICSTQPVFASWHRNSSKG